MIIDVINCACVALLYTWRYVAAVVRVFVSQRTSRSLSHRHVFDVFNFTVIFWLFHDWLLFVRFR